MKVITATESLDHPAVDELIKSMVETTNRIIKERDALKADADRLDWLELQSTSSVEESGVWAAWESDAPTLRDAIDAARAAS